MRKILFALLLVISGVMLVSPTIADAKTAQDYPKPEVGFLDSPYIKDTSNLKYGEIFEDWDGIKWQDVTGTVVYNNVEDYEEWYEDDESEIIEMTRYENENIFFSARLNVETGVFYDRIPAEEEKNNIAGFRLSLKAKSYGSNYVQYSMLYPGYYMHYGYILPYNNFSVEPEITYSKKKVADVKVVDDIYFGRNVLLIKPLKAGKTYVTIRFQSEGCCDAIYRFYVDVRAEKEYYSAGFVVDSVEQMRTYGEISSKKSKKYRYGIVAIGFNGKENKNYQPAKMLNIEIGTYKATKKWDMNYSKFLNFPQYVIKDGKAVKNKKYEKMVEIFGTLDDSGTVDERFKKGYIAIQILGTYDDYGKTEKRNRKDMYTMLVGEYNLVCWEISILYTVCLQLCGIDDVSFVSVQENHMEERAFVNGLLGDGACCTQYQRFIDYLANTVEF